MTKDEILQQVTEVIREEFEDNDLVITENTIAKDVPGWDSLAHLSLLHEIELHFEIKFTMAEIQGLKNIGELIKAIDKRVNVEQGV